MHPNILMPCLEQLCRKLPLPYKENLKYPPIYLLR